MSFASLVRSRLKAMGREQKDLARAAQVTDSYISQLLTRKKAPPSLHRTGIYGRMEAFLELPPGELTRLVAAERTEELKRRLGPAPVPLFREFRELVLRKCVPGTRGEIRAIFQKEPFGFLERLITRSLLTVVQEIARRELDRDDWLQVAARVGGRTKEEMRVVVLEFLDTDVYQVSNENCVTFLDPVLVSWDMDLQEFRMEIHLDEALADNPHRHLGFFEEAAPAAGEEARGLEEFLADSDLSGDASEEELRLLRQHRLGGRSPTGLYYYRALQNLRDPLHFRRD